MLSPGRVQINDKMDASPELGELLNDLCDLATRWYEIGLQLHLSTNELDAIKYDSKDVNECFRNMLKKWLTKTSSTWRSLIHALKSPALNEQMLAGKLEAKLPQPSNTSKHTI